MNKWPCKELQDPLFAFDSEEIRGVHCDLLQGQLANEWLWTEGVGSKLRRGVFHVTGLKGWTGIQTSGTILPNRGERNAMFEKSRSCRGWKNGGVCLFDFETPCIEIVAQQWDRCARTVFRRPASNPSEQERLNALVVIQFARRDILPGPWEYWYRTEPSIDDCVPYVECWHKNPMPLSAATAVHIVQVGAQRWNSYAVDSVPNPCLG